MIGPLHPGHNVVVGRNGSGKSNFFAAIRFVLNDAYTKLNATEERTSLIYVPPLFLFYIRSLPRQVLELMSGEHMWK